MKYLFKYTLLAIIAVACSNASAQKMSLRGTDSSFMPGTPVVIDYEGTAKGDVILLYHNLSMVPQKVKCSIKGKEGSFEVGDALQPGHYKALLMDKDDVEKASLDFSIANYPLLDVGKRIVLLSDIHVMSPELVEDADNPSFTKAMSIERKLIPQSYEIFCAYIDTIKALHPDLVIIPGDLTNAGERKSHLKVVDKLYELLDMGIPTLVIPGNHDMENVEAKTYTSDGVKPAETIVPEEFEAIYASFGIGNATSRDPYSLSYACEPFDGLVFLGIDDCRIPSRGDTHVGDAEFGRIRQETLDWVLEEADKAVDQKKVVVAAVHHQLLQHYNGQSTIMSSAATENGDSIARLFADHGIKVVLTGHMHMPNISRIPGFEKTDSLVEISSASTVTYPSQYRILTLSDDLAWMNVDTRDIESVGDIDPLQAVARDKVDSTLDYSMSLLSTRYMSVFNKMLNDFASDPVFADVISDVPTDPNELADIGTMAFAKTLRKVVFTMYEGNEQLKDAVNDVDKQMQSDCKFACDLVFDNQSEDTRAFLAYSMYIYMMDTAEDIIKSMLTDTSYMGTEWVNQTDDLYLTIRLKDVEEGIQETLATEKRSGEVVGNLSGQVMMSPLSSLPKGVYVVRKGDVVRKVMVR